MLAAEIKKTLRGGGVSMGAWMSLAHPSIAEIFAGAGFDWVVVETEHTAIDNSETLRIIMAIDGAGAVPLVRLAWNDPIQAKAVLDSGAAGLIVPMVNTREEAELAVKAAKYPPLGFRGVGLARAHGYGARFKEYVDRANEDTLLILQIEHKDAVANIEEILSVPGIDGVFIGPYDLSMSMGVPGQLDHPDVAAARAKVLKATLAHGLVAGIHLLHSEDAVRDIGKYVADGYRFIALGSDIVFLGEAARGLHQRASAAARR